MSNLIGEFLLRLAKVLAASVVGVLVFALLVGPLGNPATTELAILSWLCGAAFILLVESSPI
jgi:hypothetical protein